MTVDSRIDEGTTVTLYLPRANVRMRQTDRTSEMVPEAARGMRILLVDDDVQVRSMAAALLEEMGHDVVSMSSGPEALRFFTENDRVDLLLADYAMPGMTGVELATRAVAARPSLRILLMTGYVDAAALPEGAPVLRKPFALSELAQAVGRVMMDNTNSH